MPSKSPDVEAIVESGERVYSLSWDTGGPGGGAGAEHVYALDGLYAVVLDDGESFGPYQSLQEAISEHEQLSWVGPATTEIESSELKTAEIEVLLRPLEGVDEPTLNLKINGEERVVRLP